jgi:hypothetical protein
MTTSQIAPPSYLYRVVLQYSDIHGVTTTARCVRLPNRLEYDDDFQSIQQIVAVEFGLDPEKILILSWADLKGVNRASKDDARQYCADDAIRAASLAVMLVEEHLNEKKVSLPPSSKSKLVRLMSEHCLTIAEGEWEGVIKLLLARNHR